MANCAVSMVCSRRLDSGDEFESVFWDWDNWSPSFVAERYFSDFSL